MHGLLWGFMVSLQAWAPEFSHPAD